MLRMGMNLWYRVIYKNGIRHVNIFICAWIFYHKY
jgi:hypothetical protein